MPVLRNVGHAVQASLANALFRNVLSIQKDSSPVNGRHACYSIYKLRLAIAVDSGYCKDFPCANLKGDVFYSLLPSVLCLDGHALNLQNRFPWPKVFFVNDKVNLSSNHHLGHGLFGGFRNLYGSYEFPLSEYAAAVGGFLDFIQLVCYKNDGFPFCYKLFHNLYQLCDFLGSKYGGRLVENEDVIIAVKHF